MLNDYSNLEIPSYYLIVAGLRIHFKSMGNGSPIIFIHGGGNDWHEWERNLVFVGQYFQIYALDLPGFGLSQAPQIPISFSWYLNFVKLFMKELGVEKIAFVGHSLGAMICTSFTARYPELVRKLVLVDAGGLGKISRKGRILLSIFRITDHWMGKKRGPKYLVKPIEELQSLDDLPKIKAPTLIIWGQNDLYLPLSHARLANSLIPLSQLCVFPGCGHAPQREYSVKFNILITQFLSS